MINWEPDEDFTYQELLDRACFVKFDVNDQVNNYKRVIDKGTLDWWAKQSHHAKQTSFVPKPDDLSVEDGVKILREYYHKTTSKNKIVWVRGSLDQLVIDSLTRAADLADIAPYWSYRDVRTSIDLLMETSKNGYCQVEGFSDSLVHKHDPIHDVAYDIMQMRYGK